MKTAGVLPLALAESTCCFSRALTKAANAIDRRVHRPCAHRIFTSAITGKGSELRVGGAPCRGGGAVLRAYLYRPHGNTEGAMSKSNRIDFTRRELMRYGGSLTAATVASLQGGLLWRGVTAAGAASLRQPDSLPNPKLPAGTVNEELPFDHIVVVMMENHSFDNLLGALRLSGQKHADGLKFNHRGEALNSNPGPGGEGTVRSFELPTTAQAPSVTQTWNATHIQIDGGRMDGFPRSVDCDEPMGYWTEDVLPFAYSFARTFTLANRWFCSAPCQTYPNRRFLMAGTAYGDIATDDESLQDPPPPNGTIFDRLNAYGVSWRNYFTDLPQTAIIPSIVEKYPANITPIAEFFSDCAAGTLPSVSYVDPEFGALTDIGAPLAALPLLEPIAKKLATTGGDEESEQDMSYGEYWAYQVVTAVLKSPAWPRTLLDLHLRRARRLLRPRPAPRCDRARLDRPRTRSRRRSRGL